MNENLALKIGIGCFSLAGVTLFGWGIVGLLTLLVIGGLVGLSFIEVSLYLFFGIAFLFISVKLYKHEARALRYIAIFVPAQILCLLWVYVVSLSIDTTSLSTDPVWLIPTSLIVVIGSILLIGNRQHFIN